MVWVLPVIQAAGCDAGDVVWICGDDGVALLELYGVRVR